jgi:hypothetical protein
MFEYLEKHSYTEITFHPAPLGASELCLHTRTTDRIPQKSLCQQPQNLCICLT